MFMVSLQPISATSVPATAISGRQQLWSAATATLLVPRAQTVTGQQSFAVNGPATWNRLPPALRSLDLSESTFKWAMKTHLFSTTQHHWDVFMILAPDINIHTYLLADSAVFVVMIVINKNSFNKPRLWPLYENSMSELVPNSAILGGYDADILGSCLTCGVN